VYIRNTWTARKRCCLINLQSQVRALTCAAGPPPSLVRPLFLGIGVSLVSLDVAVDALSMTMYRNAAFLAVLNACGEKNTKKPLKRRDRDFGGQDDKTYVFYTFVSVVLQHASAPVWSIHQKNKRVRHFLAGRINRLSCVVINFVETSIPHTPLWAISLQNIRVHYTSYHIDCRI